MGAFEVPRDRDCVVEVEGIGAGGAAEVVARALRVVDVFGAAGAAALTGGSAEDIMRFWKSA